MEDLSKQPTAQGEASGETTSPERLQELAQQDVKLARIVATNPNTPTETLLELDYQFPAELLNNPVFDLLLLGNPNLLAQMPQNTLKKSSQTGNNAELVVKLGIK